MDEQASQADTVEVAEVVEAGAVTTTGAAPPEVTVKGWRNGLLLMLPGTGDWADVMAQVDTKLDEARARSFWRGAQTTLDCGNRPVSQDEMTQLSERIKRAYGLVPIAVVAQNEATRASGEKLALTAYAELPIVKRLAREPISAEPTRAATETAEKSAFYPNNALYVPNTMRSGQRVVHDGHLVVCGDVNPGAEAMAGGDVIVLGTLRGLAHAGCYGDEKARIVAGSLRSPQLRIASRIAGSPDEDGKMGGTARAPEVARVEEGEIVVFPL